MRRFAWILLFALCLARPALAAKPDSLVRRIVSYADSIRQHIAAPDTTWSTVHERRVTQTERRNWLMAFMPHHLRAVRHRQRLFLAEEMGQMRMRPDGTEERNFWQASSADRPVNRTLIFLRRCLSTRLYSETMVGSSLLSPFHRSNMRLYAYHIEPVDSLPALARVNFLPRSFNTQLVGGWALAERATGRIAECHMWGEYDLTTFDVHLVMGARGRASLRAEQCRVEGVEKFLGNRLKGRFERTASLPLPSLTEEEAALPQADSSENKPPQPKQKRRQREKWRRGAETVWDVIDDNLLSSISDEIGPRGRGRFRIGPLLNPLYLGYSNSRGITYKLRGEMEYRPSAHKSFSTRVRAGYSFRQHQFYFTVPLRFTLDDRREAWLEAQVANGNRISNSVLFERLKAGWTADSLRLADLNLSYFRDTQLQLVAHWRPVAWMAFGTGCVFHRRSAVSHGSFRVVGHPDIYRNFAPQLNLDLYLWRGCLLSVDYEHGVPGIMQSDIRYDRLETDWQQRWPLTQTQAVELRLGGGIYHSLSKQPYFLDYVHLRRNHVSGGWDDDWTGDFEMLDEHWYNASPRYARACLTYEAPLLMLAWIPVVGHIVERERLVLNTLLLNRLGPYAEVGYALTNRYFSVAATAAFARGQRPEVGIRLGLELFENW